MSKGVSAANLGTISPKMFATNTRRFHAAAGLAGCVLALALAGCDSAPLPQRSAEDLMADSVLLDGVLMKCNGVRGGRDTKEECRNARIAVERLSIAREQAKIAEREAAFERNRERLRQQQDALQQQLEAAKKVDPYKLPLIPPVGNPAPPSTASN